MGAFLGGCQSSSGESICELASESGEVQNDKMAFVHQSTVNLGTTNQAANKAARPSMKVSLDYDFFMDKHETTCGEYAALVKTQCDNDSLPIVNVTYFDAILFANEKSKNEGKDTVYTYKTAIYDGPHCVDLEGFAFHLEKEGYRLPTEAEWMLAASLEWDVNDSWTKNNSENHVHVICTNEKSNSTFCDFEGNVMEWVNDWMGPFADTTLSNFVGANGPNKLAERILKGGAFFHAPETIYAYNRTDVYSITSYSYSDHVGFRLALGKIPHFHYLNETGSVENYSVTPLVSSTTFKSIAGSSRAKLVFRNGAQERLEYIDFNRSPLKAVVIEDSISAFHPEISPNGQYVAFCTGIEGLDQPSSVYVRGIGDENNSLVKLDVKSAIAPRWRILDNGDTVIVYATSANNNSDSTKWAGQSTWQVPFANGKFGVPQKLMDGSFHGGYDPKTSMAVTGSRQLRVHAHSQNQLWYNGEQACNVSLAQDGSLRTLFLDFGGTTGRNFVGTNYGVHEMILVADSSGDLIQAIPAPKGFSFDHSEWVNTGDKSLSIVTLVNADGNHKTIALVNMENGDVHEIVDGDELWHPSLWVYQKTLVTPSTSTSTDSSKVIPPENTSKGLSSSSESEKNADKCISSDSNVHTDSTSLSTVSASSDSIFPIDSSLANTSASEYSSSSQQDTHTQESSLLPFEDYDSDSLGVYYGVNNMQAGIMRYKMELLWQFADSADVVVLGSSRPKNSIIPKSFSADYKVINLGNAYFTIYESLYLTENYILPHFKKLKYLVVALDLDMWSHTANAAGNFFYDISKKYPGYVYDENHDFWKGYETNTIYLATHESIGSGYSKFLSTLGFEDTGTGSGWPTSLHYNIVQSSNKTSYFEESYDAMVQLISNAQEKGVYVIGVIFPQAPAFKNSEYFGYYGMDRDYIEGAIENIIDLQKSYPNFVFMDENKMGNHDYGDNHAFDIDHLNYEGGLVITSRINAVLDSLKQVQIQ